MKVKKLLVSALTLITVLICCFIMTGCGKIGSVDESSMRYDGKKFTWGEVKNAVTYVVEIDGKTHTTQNASYSYTAKSSLQEVTLTVYAVGNNDKEGEATSRTFTRLEKIAKSDIDFSYDGIMSWPSVDGADEYIVYVNGKEYTVSETEYGDFEYGKNNQIKVKPNASDGSTFADYSETITKNYLAIPTGITYDGELLKWKGANVVPAGTSGVKGYRVFIDGGEYEVTTEKEIVYNANMQDFEVCIQAVGDEVENGNTFSSPESETKTFIYLPQITRDQINIKDGVMSWEEIEKADGYTLKINGARENITATSKELVSGTELNVEIKPYVEEGDVYYSVFSETISVYILNTPVVEWNNFDLSDGIERSVIRWNQVQGATGYNVRVYSPDATEPTDYSDLGEAIRDFTYAFTVPGEYRISVQGLTTIENNYPSKMSEEYIITRLPSPKLASRDAIISTPDDVTKGFTLTWDPVTGASDYQIYKDGAKVNSLATNKKNSKTIVDVIDSTVTEQKEFVYVVQSLGSINGRRINLPSIYDPQDTTKGEPCSVNITVLAQPRDLRMENFDAKWTGNGDYSLFAVKINGTTNQATTTSLNLNKIEAGTNYVSVCSKGNGTNVLASNYTPTEEVYKIHKPTALKIGTSVNEGELSWSISGDEDCASSYIVNIRGGYDPLECNGAVNISNYIDENGVTVGVTAIANTYNLNETVYYMTSDESDVRTFIRLETPTFNETKVEDRKLKWNAPKNAGNSSFDYSLFNGDGQTIQTRLSSNQFDINGYDAGRYSFSVKCIGDGTTYLNSSVSEIVTIRILATPEITVGEFGYSWNVIDFATAYQVTVDGVLVDTIKTGEELFYKPTTFKQIKEYEVGVYAVGDGGKTLVDSKSDIHTQKTVRLNTPTITVSYDSVSGRYENNGKVVLTVTQAVENANGYNYTIGGASGTSNELTYSVIPNKKGEITVSVFAIGGRFSANGEYYYLDSHSTTDPTNIWLLDAPSKDSINVYESGAIEWTDIAKNYGYDVKIYFEDGNMQEIQVDFNEVTSSQLEYSSKIIKVEISARGNGTTIISSNFVVWEK